MIIPDNIKIGGHKVEVKKVRTDIEKNQGSFDNWYKIIHINIDGTSASTQEETFLHEILEAVKANYNLTVEHIDLTVISEVLFSVIRANNLDFREGK